MKILSSASFSKISPLINNENYSSVYTRLKLKLTPDEIGMFAIPDFPIANSGSWQADVNALLKTYRDASSVEKEEIATYIEEKKMSIMPKMKGMPYANVLFRVPDEGQIFWYRDNVGEMKVILAQWGFAPVANGRDVDLIEVILNLPRPLTQMAVKLYAMYSDGEPARNCSFEMTIFNHNMAFKTNEEGFYSVGKMYVGKKFSVKDDKGDQFDFVVTPGQSDYYATFDIETDCTIRVINQFDEPVSNYALNVDGNSYSTDDTGVVEVKGLVLTKDKKIRVMGTGGVSQEYALERDAEQNKFEYRIKVEVMSAYTIKVIDQHNHVKPEYSLVIDGRTETTDATGMIRVDNIVWTEGLGISVSSAEGVVTNYDIAKDPQDNNFVYHITIVPPVERKVRIKVLDYDGSILPGIEVFVDTKKHGTISAFTNEEGYATFKADEFEDKEKAKVHFLVSKEYRERKNAEKKNTIQR